MPRQLGASLQSERGSLPNTIVELPASSEFKSKDVASLGGHQLGDWNSGEELGNARQITGRHGSGTLRITPPHPLWRSRRPGAPLHGSSQSRMTYNARYTRSGQSLIALPAIIRFRFEQFGGGSAARQQRPSVGQRIPAPPSRADSGGPIRAATVPLRRPVALVDPRSANGGAFAPSA
jgi:hypothetical protein